MNNDTEEAWIAFKNKGTSIAKASVAEKLDVIAAQLNEIQTDTKRTAEIVPKIMGDESAIDEANASADMGMPPMGGDMMGGAPPEDAMMGAEGGEMPGEEMPPEEGAMPDMGAEEGMPPAEEPLPEEGEAPMGDELGDVDEGTEDLIGDVEGDELDEYEDLDKGDDGEVIESLKDALQEALDNDEMGLVSKIANAISMLQGSTQGSADILSGAEELADEGMPEEGLPGDEEEFEGAVDVTDEEEAPAEGASEESESEEETEEVDKSAIAKMTPGAPSVGAGGASPEGDASPGQIASSPDGATRKEASSTEEIKVKVMEAVADGLDEALDMDFDEEEDDEDYDEEDEGEDDDGEDEESETEEKNKAIADNPFEECGEGTMKSALKTASEMSFKDLLSVKKSWHFGVDGRFAKTGDATPSLLDDQMPDVAENAVEDEVVEDEVEEIPLEDVESAKDVLNAPDALEPGVRTEVEETEVSENETMPTETDEVGEPLNVSNVDSGLDDENEVLEEVDKSAFEKTHYGTTEKQRENSIVSTSEEYPGKTPESDAEWSTWNHEQLENSDAIHNTVSARAAETHGGRPIGILGRDEGVGSKKGSTDKHLEKSATLDEIGKPCEDLKSGKSTKPKDMLDDVDEKKTASGSAEPKPTIADEVGDADKSTNKGAKAKSMLDDLDAKKGTGSEKDPDDLLDQVGHKKRSTEHTVRPGTGLLDDVDEVKKSEKKFFDKDAKNQAKEHTLNGKEYSMSNVGKDYDKLKGTLYGRTKSKADLSDEDYKAMTESYYGDDQLPPEQRKGPASWETTHKQASASSENGKHIMSFQEMLSIRKSSQRPDVITTTSGDIVRPELGAPVRKSANVSSPRMGRGVDPKKVVENDWAEYNLYMAQKKL